MCVCVCVRAYRACPAISVQHVNFLQLGAKLHMSEEKKDRKKCDEKVAHAEATWLLLVTLAGQPATASSPLQLTSRSVTMHSQQMLHFPMHYQVTSHSNAYLLLSREKNDAFCFDIEVIETQVSLSNRD